MFHKWKFLFRKLNFVDKFIHFMINNFKYNLIETTTVNLQCIEDNLNVDIKHLPLLSINLRYTAYFTLYNQNTPSSYPRKIPSEYLLVYKLEQRERRERLEQLQRQELLELERRLEEKECIKEIVKKPSKIIDELLEEGQEHLGCKVCFKHKISVALVKCGHTFCNSCTIQFNNKCAVCRTLFCDYDEKIRIHI
jgi:hypothetical protein